MALGQPLVAPDGVTFPEITGRDTPGAPSEGYPFLFKTRDQQKDMLRALITEPQLRAEWGAKASEHVGGA